MLHLARVSSAFAAIGNVWFVILWTRASIHEPGNVSLGERPLWALLPGGAALALGLYAFGAVLNDILDVRRDRLLHPERPIASGRISLETALALVVATLVFAVLGSTVFGTGAVLVTLLLAATIFLFNAIAKFIPAIGLVALGLIYAGHMLVPNLGLHFVWPVWLVMTHALGVAAATHIVGRKVPRISRRAGAAALAGWIFWSAVLLAIGWSNAGQSGPLWPAWVSLRVAIGPGLLALAFIVIALRKVKASDSPSRAAEKLARYGSLWLVLYACAWLFGAGFIREGAILSGVAIVAALGLTALREVYGLVEQPVSYRR